MKRLRQNGRRIGFEMFRRRAAWLSAPILSLALAAASVAAPQSEQDAEGPAGSALSVQDFVELSPAYLPAPSASLHCSLDVIGDHAAPLAMVLDHRTAATFVGWIADDGKGVPRNIALLLIGSRTYAAEGTTGLARSDVAAAKHNPAFAFSGYSVTGKPVAAPQGEYHLAMIGHFGTVRLLCPLGHTIAIK